MIFHRRNYAGTASPLQVKTTGLRRARERVIKIAVYVNARKAEPARSRSEALRGPSRNLIPLRRERIGVIYAGLKQRMCGIYLARWVPLAATLVVLLVPAPDAASAQVIAPAWKLTVTPNADYFLPGPAGENNVYTIEAENTGTGPTSGPIRLEDIPPVGLSATGVHFFASPVGFNDNAGDELAEKGDCSSFFKCEYPDAPGLSPGEKLVMEVRVAVPADPDPSGPLSTVAKVSGGGATKVTGTATNEASTGPPIGFHAFEAPLTDFSTAPYTQAGGHPYQLTTEFVPSTRAIPRPEGNNEWRDEGLTPVLDPKDVHAELPPGLIGNPQAVPGCPLADFFLGECPISTVVGDVGLKIEAPGSYQGGLGSVVPLFNLQPSIAHPGELGYAPLAAAFFLTASLRSGSDYGITLNSSGVPPVTLTRVHVVTWGVPAAAEHDAMRGKYCAGGQWQEDFVQSIEQIEHECEAEPGTLGNLHGGPAGVPPTPFLTTPTSCEGELLRFRMRYDVWENSEEATAVASDPAVDGCNQLEFEPTIEARPTTNLADSPAGFEVDLRVPQNQDPEGVATPDLKEAVVKLPPGLLINPSSGAGLEGCSPAQIGLTTPVGTIPAHFTESPAACPDASKLGTVEVKTPLLHEPLGSIESLPGRLGAVYLATPHQNPSASLLAAYIVLEGQGIVIKLAGQFQTDPQTGQITASFLENPQTPFEEFKFHFFEGARGALRTPAICGSYQVHSTLTPYSAPESGPPAEPSSEFETTAGPGGEGSRCPTSSPTEEPNAPAFRAGTESSQAGAYSPFSLKLVRQDGEQEIKQIETTLPPGLVGKLAGVGECSEAALTAAAKKSGAEERSDPSCPASSEVGSVDVASGAGPTPLHVSGKVYLAGPYKGAPLSLAIVTPALAGPFDLGTVVVRTALYINPETAQITAKSDQIPTILEGIPLDVRSITLQMSRPDFTLNPTDCEELHITGAALSVLNASAPLSQRFQVGGCPALRFKPSLSLRFKGAVRRLAHPAIIANLKPRPGDANIAFAQVQLPKAAFLDQGNLDSICTKVQFAAEQCPPSSIYGKASATTPLLDYPLTGNVYLRSAIAGHKLPDLVADLHGPPNQPLRFALVGKTDSVGGALRNTFEAAPDVPVSSFRLELFGGPKKGLIQMSSGFCANPDATVKFIGQNAKAVETEAKVKALCPKKKGKDRHRHRHGAR